MPTSGSDSRSNIRGSIYQLVVGSQAYRHDHSVGRSQAYRHDHSVGRSQAYRHDHSVGKSQVYQRDQYRNSRHSGAIGLSMVYGSTVLAQGQFRRRIGTNSCLSSGNSSFIGRRLISTTIIGIAGVSARSVVCVGSSTVPATGSFGWQCNASNGVRIP